jgi:DNA-binding SARP family transcriptional activator
MTDMRFRLLGPVAVETGGDPVVIGSRGRLALVVLLLHSGPVPGDLLVSALWGDSPPDGAAKTLRVILTRLRRCLEPERRSGDPSVLLRVADGWVLGIEPDQVDAHCFEHHAALSRCAHEAGRPADAAASARRALGEWRGAALAGVVDDLELARAPAQRWEELRLVTIERAAEAELALGHHQELAVELAGLVDAHPFQERLAGLAMIALYRSGRQTDALGIYDRLRRRLADELGLWPTPALVELEGAILRHQDELELPALLPGPNSPTRLPATRPGSGEPAPGAIPRELPEQFTRDERDR